MKITENFTYIGTQQNFERDSYTTLAEMKAAVDKRMPDIFTATCKETGKFYIYNKNNEVDETLGKWREIGLDGDDYVTKTYLDTELANKSNIDHTHTTVNGHTIESDVPADAKFTDTVYDDTDIKAEIANKADVTSIPSKVSDLENDSNYLSSIPEEYVTETELSAKGYLTEHQDISGKVDKVEGKSLISDTEIARLASVDNYDDTDIRTELANKADTTAVPSKVSELANDSNYQTAEQVNSTVTTEIAKVVADAPEDLNTLKEMSDWIAGHENDASAMNSAISDNKTAITALQSGKADKTDIPTTVAELTDSADYAKKTDLHSHTNKTVLDGITSTKVSNWDSAKTHADSAHAPSNAQANVIETVKVNGTALTPSSKAVNVIVPTKVSELTDSSDYAKKTDIPTTLPANGGNANTVNNHTVKSDVPENAVFTDTVLEINDESTSETTVWSSSKIANKITNEATTRQNADTALQSALALRKSYDFVVDSNETLLEWANCKDGSMKSVLVKSGEYTLGGKMINLVNAGTKFVFAENGNKIKVSNMQGIGATEDYGAVVVGLNVELSYRIKAEGCYAFYRGMICYNCTGSGSGSDSSGDGYGFYGCTCSNCTGTGTGADSRKGYGFYNCTCSNCTGSGRSGRAGSCYGFYGCTCSNCTGSGGGAYNDCYGFYGCTCSNCTGSGSGVGYGSGYGFFNCSYCSSCRAGETSKTATWGGTNTYIDSDSCDYVAS